LCARLPAPEAQPMAGREYEDDGKSSFWIAPTPNIGVGRLIFGLYLAKILICSGV